jgi:hypothetical protein
MIAELLIGTGLLLVGWSVGIATYSLADYYHMAYTRERRYRDIHIVEEHDEESDDE